MNTHSREHEVPPTEHLVGCIALAAGETLRIVDPQSVLVHVPQGRIWVTEDRLAEDVVLDVGGWHWLTRPGTAVVEALSPAVLMLTSPHEAGFARELATSERPALTPVGDEPVGAREATRQKPRGLMPAGRRLLGA